MHVSGASTKQAAVASNYFSNMCLAGEQSPFLKEIDKVNTCSAVEALIPAHTLVT